MVDAAAVGIIPDNLALVVDPGGNGVPHGCLGRIVQRGIAAAAVKKAVEANAVVIIPDDLASVVDAIGIEGERDQGIVERGVGIYCHALPP